MPCDLFNLHTGLLERSEFKKNLFLKSCVLFVIGQSWIQKSVCVLWLMFPIDILGNWKWKVDKQCVARLSLRWRTWIEEAPETTSPQLLLDYIVTAEVWTLVEWRWQSFVFIVYYYLLRETPAMLYMVHLGHIIQNNIVTYYSYSDNDLLTTVSPSNHDLLDSLCQCLEEVNCWMQLNSLQLNKDWRLKSLYQSKVCSKG